MTAVITNGASHVGSRGQQVDLTWFLRNQPHTFLQPTLQHQQAAVAAAKAWLDPLAASVIQSQTARRNENRRKRKRGSDEVEDPLLQLRQVYTSGLAVKQVWEQARRIIDAACTEVEHAIEDHREKYGSSQEDIANTLNSVNGSDSTDNEEVDDEEDLGLDEDDSPGREDGFTPDEDDFRADDDHEDVGEDVDAMSVADVEPNFDTAPAVTYEQDPNKLNDGFFSIDDFNKQSQFLEQMDARGDNDNPSDEDEIDFDTDPLAQSLPISKAKQRSSSSKQVANENTASEEDLPTFGNADLNAPDTDEEGEGGDIDDGDLEGIMSGMINTNDIRYADFFEPPPKRPSNSKRTRALPKTQPPAEAAAMTAANEDEGDFDVERAIADVRRDLLDSDEEVDDEEEDEDLDDNDEDALPRLSAGKLANKNLSTHEKQRVQIAEEIRRLEAVNVSKKPWTLSGEASAGARPLNSLIEEDLEFERTGKPVPVITAEISTDIEALIKRRILARDFDEIVHRLPTALDSTGDTRRGRVEVDDTKATTGLGEMYESEYQKNADPTSYVDKRSVATKKQHDEIDKLWKEVREQLDVLSNFHIKPKRAEIDIKTVEDKPRIAMEDARPAASGGIDDHGAMLAPQEIYRPGADSRAETGEALNAKSGASRSKEEMTREEKTRRRRREKERQKKAANNQQAQRAAPGKKPSKKEEHQNVLKDLQKGGARVIGKDGSLQELNAKNKKNGLGPAVTGGSLKL